MIKLFILIIPNEYFFTCNFSHINRLGIRFEYLQLSCSPIICMDRECIASQGYVELWWKFIRALHREKDIIRDYDVVKPIVNKD